MPVLLSEGHVLRHLKMIQKNGYSVFVVKGKLTSCLADRQLEHNPRVLIEYQEQTKDMPKMIVDGKVIGTEDSLVNGNLRILLPKPLMERYKKNPDDPEVEQLILNSLPEDLRKQVALGGPSSSKAREKMFLMVDDDMDEIDDIVQVGCDRPNCPACHGHPLSSGNSLQEQFSDEQQMEKLIRSHQGARVMVTQTAQLLVTRPDPNHPNAPSQQGARVLVTQTAQLLVTRPNPNHPNASSQQGTTARDVLIIAQRRGMPSSVGDQIHPTMNEKDSHMGSSEDLLLRQAIARSLLDQGAIDDIEDPVLREQMKKEYQETFDELYARELYLRDTEGFGREEMSRAMALSRQTIHSEPVRTLMPPLPSVVTNPPPLVPSESLSTSMNTPVSPPLLTSNVPLSSPMEKTAMSSVNTSSPAPPPTAMPNSPQPIVKNATPPTTPILEPTVTTHAPSPKLTPQNSSESPTIEGKFIELALFPS